MEKILLKIKYSSQDDSDNFNFIFPDKRDFSEPTLLKVSGRNHILLIKKEYGSLFFNVLLQFNISPKALKIIIKITILNQ